MKAITNAWLLACHIELSSSVPIICYCMLIICISVYGMLIKCNYLCFVCDVYISELILESLEPNFFSEQEKTLVQSTDIINHQTNYQLSY